MIQNNIPDDDQEDRVDNTLLDLLMHCERLAEFEHQHGMALVIHEAHLKCCQIAASRRRKRTLNQSA